MTKKEKQERDAARLKELLRFDETIREEQGVRNFAGWDEVGRGPLAGPVVSCAVVLPPDFDILGVDDSKKLTDKKRRELAPRIMEEAVCFGFGERSSEEIDRINILEATREAARDAVKNCAESYRKLTGEELTFVLFDALQIENLGVSHRAVIKGDQSSCAIAAASILAKVKRDDWMIEMDSVYPGYEFAKNKGYGTKAHYEGIRKYGITPIHRRSFLKNLRDHI
ncbi:MAG: ribonuclease HII [Eubacteriales bacterium]|nr:ribonuclease HII [Eubacteriales bacterium]